MTTKHSKSLALLEEVLESLQKRPGGYLTSAIRKLELVAELTGDRKLGAWCDFHLGRYRLLLPRQESDEDLSDYVERLIAKLRELKVELPLDELVDRLGKSGGGLQSIEYIEDRLNQLNKEKRGNDGTHYRGNMTNVITSTANGAARHASRLYSTVAFGEIPRHQFDVIRERVDNLLLDIYPDAVEQFMKAYERLSATSSEDWSLALTACRRVIKSVADAIYPATEAEINGRKLGDPQYINRLWAFLDENVPSSSDKDLAKAHVDYLGSFLQRLNEKASKGVHATVTHDEAVRSVLYTYLTIGDLLEFGGGAISETLATDHRVDVNSATFDKLIEVDGVTTSLAKQIIKARSKTPFTRIDDLQSLKGVGPKTLDRLREHLVVIPVAKK